MCSVNARLVDSAQIVHTLTSCIYDFLLVVGRRLVIYPNIIVNFYAFPKVYLLLLFFFQLETQNGQFYLKSYPLPLIYLPLHPWYDWYFYFILCIFYP